MSQFTNRKRKKARRAKSIRKRNLQIRPRPGLSVIPSRNLTEAELVQFRQDWEKVWSETGKLITVQHGRPEHGSIHAKLVHANMLADTKSHRIKMPCDSRNADSPFNG